jgi:hypothetical protein
MTCLISAAGASAQSMANFESRRLAASGGEMNAKNNSATVYHGFVDISEEGKISGVLARREFGATKTNSVSKPVTINSGASKIFGTVIKLGENKNIETNSTGKITTTDTLYAADFHIITSLPGFMVKGRALQQVSTTVTDHVGGGRSTNKEIDVSLQGISMAPKKMRGFFNAD